MLVARFERFVGWYSQVGPYCDDYSFVKNLDDEHWVCDSWFHSNAKIGEDIEKYGHTHRLSDVLTMRPVGTRRVELNSVPHWRVENC